MEKKRGRPKKEKASSEKSKLTPEEVHARRVAALKPYMIKPGEKLESPGRPKTKIGLPPEGPGGRLDPIKIANIIAVCSGYCADELNQVLSDPNARVFDKIVCRNLLNSQVTGKFEALEPMLKRGFGAVEQLMKLGVGPLKDLTVDEQIKAGREALERLEAAKLAREREDEEDRLHQERKKLEEGNVAVIIDPDDDKELEKDIETASESIKWLK